MVELRDIHSQVAEAGYQLIAISPDRPEKVRESIAEHALNFHPLSDSQMAAARALGIAYKVDEATLQKLKSFGVDLAEASGQAHFMLPVPAVFLVGANGGITFEYVNPDYSRRIKPELLLAALRANLK